jgi:hypothetical protein
MEHWTRDGRDLDLMLLGAVLASRAVATDVFAAVDGSDLSDVELGRVFTELKAAMTGGGVGEVTKRWLKRRGAEVNGGKAIDAVLTAVKESTRKKRLERVLAEIRMANTLGDTQRVAELIDTMKGKQ